MLVGQVGLCSPHREIWEAVAYDLTRQSTPVDPQGSSHCTVVKLVYFQTANFVPGDSGDSGTSSSLFSANSFSLKPDNTGIGVFWGHGSES